MRNVYFVSPRRNLGSSETTNLYKTQRKTIIGIDFMKHIRSHCASLPGVAAGVITEVARRLFEGRQTFIKSMINHNFVLADVS